MKKKYTAMDYKRDFLKANRCTTRQFELAYIEFAESQPEEKDYRDFAKKWNITIYKGLGHPAMEAILSVNVASVKVMAASNEEADNAVREILGEFENK